MFNVMDGLVLTLFALFLRAGVFPGRKADSCWYGKLLLIALAGSVWAGCGFAELAQSPIVAGDYATMLVVLGLLAAALLVVFFSLKQPAAAADDVVMPSVMSAAFLSVFYAVFGVLSFYIGTSGMGHHLPGAVAIWSFTAWAVMVIAVVYDFWTYRK